MNKSLDLNFGKFNFFMAGTNKNQLYSACCSAQISLNQFSIAEKRN